MRKRVPWVVFLCLMFIAVYCTGESYFNGKSTTARVLEKATENAVHNHSYERWGAVASSPSGTDIADFDTMTAFQVDAGNDDWGSWLQILGTDDTPVDTGKQLYDLHRIFLTAVERTNTDHRMQIAFGTSATVAVAAGDYTAVMFQPAGAQAQEFPVEVQAERQTSGTEAWARLWSTGQNTGTVDFFFGLHGYDN